ncbi:MAG: hypothetical protein KAQ67_05080 [Gammaproteobacteria bacterium]|nr:hypothetical protein [Gammaproteobacteria bacterium]
MKNTVPLFRSIDKRLNRGLFVSFLCVTLVEFIFDRTHEIFPGGAKLGDILSNLSLAFIASYIFYVVVIHFKYIKDKEHLDPYIALKSRQVVASIRELTGTLIRKADGEPENKYPSKLEFKEITKKTHFKDPAPDAYRMMLPDMNTMWDFSNYWKKLCEERLKDVLTLSLFLESEHIKLLLNIQEDGFYSIMGMFEEMELNNNFSSVSNSLYSLSQSAKKLDEYNDLYFSKTISFKQSKS